MSTTPARPAEGGGADQSAQRTLVRFQLSVDEGWPPYPIEVLAAERVGEGTARLIDVPLFANDISAGDLVRVSASGDGGSVTCRGRHSTVRVVAATAADLDEPRGLIEALGCLTRSAPAHPVLSVDVPERLALEDLLVLLDSRCSATLTYTVACLQHRITPMSPTELGPAVRRPRPGGAVPDDEDVQMLEHQLRGRVVRLGDEDWDTARRPWNLAVDQRPALVVEVADAFDVRAVVRYAGERDLRVAPQGTGHNAGPLGDLSGAILLRTGRLDAIEVDENQRTVRVGAGVIWADVVAALAPLGLAALAGSSPDVGVAGYALAGGYSWLGRRYGLAVSSVRAVELVTGDGAFHRVDADSEPDLFWAVRGGGANVGVVTALELDVFPVADVYAGALLFPLSRATEILSAYEEWTRALDESATTCIRLLRVPPLPDIPEPLRGNAFVMIDGAIDGTDDEAAALLLPLRTLGPVMDSFARMPTSRLSLIHLDPSEPVPAVGDGLSLADLAPQTIDVLVKHAGPGVDTALLAVDLRHLGGAFARPDARGGAVDHLPGRFLLYAVGVPSAPEVEAELRRQVESLVGELQPWAAPVDCLNFRERTAEPGRLFARPQLDRLRLICDRADPGHVLAANHPVG